MVANVLCRRYINHFIRIGMKIELLKIDYESQKPKAIRFMNSIIEQLRELLDKNEITLGTPIENRIKTLQSIEDKLVRKDKSITTVAELDDFVGIRIIVLFKSDIDKTCSLILNNFNVVDEENVSERLSDDQFGYQSNHYTIKLPEEWLKLPTLLDLGELKAEVQIRTLSQHIWAVASHKLQYKQENNIPVPLRRSINRVSALLETVDLEFERVLLERQNYKDEIDERSGFNVVVLESLCDKLLPEINKHYGNENYAEIFNELLVNNIKTVDAFNQLINKHLTDQLEDDHMRAMAEPLDPNRDEIERLQRGVFFTHVGLVRGCLQAERGTEYKYVYTDND